MRFHTFLPSLVLLLISDLIALNKALLPSRISHNSNVASRLQRLALSSSQDAAGISLEAEIRSMRAREIKAELTKIGVSTVGLFEKEELVQSLLKSRRETAPNTQSTQTVPTPKASSGAISAPLYFTNLDTDLKIAAVNMSGGITLNPSDQPYATVKIEVQEKGNVFALQLLLDTACSGFVLRPSVVEKHNLPKMSTPVTLTGAGGTMTAQGLTQISRFAFGGETFGPLPAAVQDIGALPQSLDGIIGLSFLNQFSCVDMDFMNGQVTLYRKGEVPPPGSVSGSLVSQGTMSMIPHLGLYAVDAFFGGRGPVKMLVDSGAANTFLSWYGIDKLGISRDNNSVLKRLDNPMGAMGSDNNVAMLTHRIHVSSTLQLGSKTNGLSLKNEKRLHIDIGDIAILDSLQPYGVCGILGIDALMRCSCVRMTFGTSQQEVLLFE
jgi:predicted aspartyl protease